MVNTAKTPAPQATSLGRSRRRLPASERGQQILNGAVALFARRGLDANLRELASELGVTHALLYHYFPTKQALLERVYDTVFAGQWNPVWEALLDGRLEVEDKICTFYREYLGTIATPVWLRIFMHSGMSDGQIPQRYFALLRERLFPRLVREARRAHGSRRRGPPSHREEGLLMGLHGGLVYHLGIVPLCYGQPVAGANDPAVVEQFIRDRVKGYLAQAGQVLAEESYAPRSRRVAPSNV